MKSLFILLLPLLLLAHAAWGAEDNNKKQIDFEGDVVEGVNKQPLDSLNQISDQNGGRHRTHLYRRRKPTEAIRTENRETVRELAETY